ncbi:MAG: DUF4192 domain-containing protein [Bifidobacteriaceae bacterium]|jgi:hypothetical protein|nr:DUF4192 domain-containing protein [Bifidobacteriaceae bacterium]
MTAPPYIVREATGLDVVAMMPGRIGFDPANSIVVAGLHPPRGRVGIVIRIDHLPTDLTALAAAAQQQAERLFDSGARASFVIRYVPPGSADVEGDEAFWTWADLIGERLPVVGCWDAVGQSYQEIDPDARLRAGPVYSEEDLRSTRGAATAAMAGLAPRAAREDLAKMGQAPKAARKSARAAERRATDQSLSLGRDSMARWRVAGLEIWLDWQRQLMEKPALAIPAPQLGRIAALLGDQVGRDAVMASAFAHCGQIPRQLARGQQLGAIFDPWSSPGLDYPRAGASLALLERVGAHLTPRRRGAVYALGSAWHWWFGNGPAAMEWARAGLDCNDCPQLASLILALVGRGVFPAALERQVP